MKYRFLLILLFICIIPQNSAAQYLEDHLQEDNKEDEIKWQLHESKSGIFSVRFPAKYKYKIFPFQYNENNIAFTTEIIAPLKGDEATENNIVSIKATHTLGGAFSEKRTRNILKKVSAKYVAIAKGLDASVLTNEPIKHKGFLGHKIHMVFDSDGEKHGMRLHILVTNQAIIEMIVTAPRDGLFSYRIDDFFNSITPIDGIVTQNNPLGVGWIPNTSTNNIFTAHLPPKNSEYTPVLASFQANSRIERMKYEIVDPVLKYKSFFNVTSYKIGRNVTKNYVTSLLFSKHVVTFVPNASQKSLKIDEVTVNGLKTLRVKLIIAAPKSLPYLNTMALEAHYKGDTILVKEFLSGPQHARSQLGDTFFSLIDFHPEKYTKPPEPKKAKKTEDVKDAQTP